MDFVETEGDTIDQAIQVALQTLGVTRDRISVEILSEGKKGILGFGAQKARIRAAVRTPSFDARGVELNAPVSEIQAIDTAATELIDRSRTVLAEILKLMGFNASIEIRSGQPSEETVLEVHAESSALLIGRKGQTLEALQYLVTRIVGERPGTEGPHVVIDVENYRERRRKSLEDMALRLGEKAKRQRKTVTVDALSAADRRIIHTALQDDPWVTTRSLGQGSYRRLLIIPEGDRKRKEEVAATAADKQGGKQVTK
jgi:spoIIIJ-associated protein